MKKQLRHCSAYVHDNFDIEAVKWNDNGVAVHSMLVFNDAPAHNIFTLESYSSIVAAYDQNTNTLYVFPRWDYSVTTQSHIRKFAADYAGVNLTSADIRRGDSIAIKCDGFYTRFCAHLRRY